MMEHTVFSVGVGLRTHDSEDQDIASTPVGLLLLQFGDVSHVHAGGQHLRVHPAASVSSHIITNDGQMRQRCLIWWSPLLAVDLDSGVPTSSSLMYVA